MFTKKYARKFITALLIMVRNVRSLYKNESQKLIEIMGDSILT